MKFKIPLLLVMLVTNLLSAQILYDINNPSTVPVIEDFYGMFFKKLENNNILIAGIDLSTTSNLPSSLNQYNFGQIRLYDSSLNYQNVTKIIPNGNTDQCCSSKPLSLYSLDGSEIFASSEYRRATGFDQYQLLKYDATSDLPIVEKNFFNTDIRSINSPDGNEMNALVITGVDNPNNDWLVPYNTSEGGVQMFFATFDSNSLELTKPLIYLGNNVEPSWITPELAQAFKWGTIRYLSNGNILVNHTSIINTTKISDFKIIDPSSNTIVNSLQVETPLQAETNEPISLVEDVTHNRMILSVKATNEVTTYDINLNDIIEVYNFDFNYFPNISSDRIVISEIIDGKFITNGISSKTFLDSDLNLMYTTGGLHEVIGGINQLVLEGFSTTLFINDMHYNIFFAYNGTKTFNDAILADGTQTNISLPSQNVTSWNTALIPIDTSTDLSLRPSPKSNLPVTINHYENINLNGDASNSSGVIRYENGFDFSQLDTREDINDMSFDIVPSDIYSIKDDTFGLPFQNYPWYLEEDGQYFYNIIATSQDIPFNARNMIRHYYQKTFLTDFTNVNDFDTDGDGVSDSIDDDSNDPCIPIQNVDYDNYDYTNTIWLTANCDGDNSSNGEEYNCDTNPYDESEDCTLNIEDNTITSIVIYPNPAKDKVYISNIEEEEFVIRLYDATGKELISQLNNNVIDVSRFDTGVYFVKIQMKNQLIRKSIVIK